MSKIRGGSRSTRTDNCQRPVQLFDHFDRFEIARRIARRNGGNLRYQDYLNMSDSQRQSLLSAASDESNDAK